MLLRRKGLSVPFFRILLEKRSWNVKLLLHCELGSVLRSVSRSHACWENRVVQYPDDTLEVLLRVYGSSNLA
jgi:hypothetical protein